VVDKCERLADNLCSHLNVSLFIRANFKIKVIAYFYRIYLVKILFQKLQIILKVFKIVLILLNMLQGL